MLSLNVPYLPQAYALPSAVIDPSFLAEFDQFLKGLKQTDLALIAQQAEIYARTGAINDAIRSGQYAGTQLQNLTLYRDRLIQAGGAGAAAGLTSTVMPQLLQALAMGGILFGLLIDPIKLVELVAKGDTGYDDSIFNTGNLFYDFVVNLTWLDKYTSLWARADEIAEAGGVREWYPLNPIHQQHR